MRDIVQVLILGLLSGAIYALFAVGIALLYRGTRSINFALGEIGTISLYALWWISTDHGFAWPIGLAGALLVGIGIGLAFERFVIRAMGKLDRVTMAVASIGLLSFLLAFEFKFFGGSPRELPAPISGHGIRIADITVIPTAMLSFFVIAAVTVVLTVLLRRTDFGLGVLAAAQDPDATRLVGVPVRRVSAFVWATAAALAVVAMFLLVPRLGVFRPAQATEIYVKSLVGAVAGGINSITGAVIGAFAVGIAEAAIVKWLSHLDLAGIDLLGFFVIVLVVLLARPTGLFATARTRTAA